MLPIAYAPSFCHPLPEGHRFPMEKYQLLPEQLLHEGSAYEGNFFVPQPVSDQDVLRLHLPAYVHKLLTLSLSKSEERKTGFPLSNELVQREFQICGGTLQGAIKALEVGVAMNIAGGTHHAFADRGEGFCLLHDQAIAAAALLEQQLVKRVLFVDLDVHQGNGTAALLGQRADCFTWSMHGANNYPLHKEQSHLDTPLPDGTTDKHYLGILENELPRLLDQFQPDFVFYQSGVDVLETDKLGRLALTLKGCKRRDQMVINHCKKNKIPLQISMGGGYSPDIKTILEAHANTFRLVQETYF